MKKGIVYCETAGPAGQPRRIMTSQSTKKKKSEEKKYPQKMAIGKKKGQLQNSEETQEVWKQSEGLQRGRCHSVSTWGCNVGNSI